MVVVSKNSGPNTQTSPSLPLANRVEYIVHSSGFALMNA